MKLNLELVMKKTEEGWEASIPAVGIKELGENEDEAIDKATDTFNTTKDGFRWTGIQSNSH